MSGELDQVDEQTHITELSIAPDGRVYVFGMSREILEVLETIGPDDLHLQLLLRQVREASCSTGFSHRDTESWSI